MRICNLLLLACATGAVLVSSGATAQLSTVELLAEVPQCAVSAPPVQRTTRSYHVMKNSHIAVIMSHVKLIKLEM